MISSKEKGDIAATKIIADLTEKGYNIFIPAVSQYLRFDMIAHKDGKFIRIQAKYSSNGSIRDGTSYYGSSGSYRIPYNKNDFDYYGVYLAANKQIIYPSIEFAGSMIRTELPNSAMPFYWWEDFCYFTDRADKKHYRDFGVELTHKASTITDKVIASNIKDAKLFAHQKKNYINYCGKNQQCN